MTTLPKTISKATDFDELIDILYQEESEKIEQQKQEKEQKRLTESTERRELIEKKYKRIATKTKEKERETKRKQEERRKRFSSDSNTRKEIIEEKYKIIESLTSGNSSPSTSIRGPTETMMCKTQLHGIHLKTVSESVNFSYETAAASAIAKKRIEEKYRKVKKDTYSPISVTEVEELPTMYEDIEEILQGTKSNTTISNGREKIRERKGKDSTSIRSNTTNIHISTARRERLGTPNDPIPVDESFCPTNKPEAEEKGKEEREEEKFYIIKNTMIEVDE